MYAISLFYSWNYNILKISLAIACQHYSHWMKAALKCIFEAHKALVILELLFKGKSL